MSSVFLLLMDVAGVGWWSAKCVNHATRRIILLRCVNRRVSSPNTGRVHAIEQSDGEMDMSIRTVQVEYEKHISTMESSELEDEK